MRHARHWVVALCASLFPFAPVATAEGSSDEDDDAAPLAKSDASRGAFSANFNFDEHHQSLALTLAGSLTERFRSKEFVMTGGTIGYTTQGDMGGGVHGSHAINLSLDVLNIDGDGEVERRERAYDVYGIAEYARVSVQFSGEDDAVVARAEAALGFGFARTWYVGRVPNDLDRLRVLSKHSRTILFIGFWAAHFYTKRPPHNEYGGGVVPAVMPEIVASEEEEFNSYGPALIIRSRRRSGFSFDMSMLGLPAPRDEDIAMPHAEIVVRISAPLDDPLFLFGNVTLVTSNHDDAHQHTVFNGYTGLGIYF